MRHEICIHLVLLHVYGDKRTAAVLFPVEKRKSTMEELKQGADTLFVLIGAVMVLAMHAGFDLPPFAMPIKRMKSWVARLNDFLCGGVGSGMASMLAIPLGK